ncbi:hypothetical protein AHMF7605_04210 [Adhaeribacter arboris]|uniref:YdhG-like domain-containing protein n=1 Tax=Adhaeribacter arboris TaxID=2072846 RepID=A0A2T2YB93_9BACT|nr:DUF1801 domain-containing protein [Adhaeribacter arboris]PSR52782.1 hypothetical protein AHMF7605_04210 [Adhaeribacter arboris]
MKPQSMNNSANIDQYIQDFPPEIQERLQQLRTTIREITPEAEEKISYGIPTFYLQGNLVHFGAYKNHIGFYPAPSGIQAFQEELATYEGGKGTIKFPLNKPLPVDLIKKIVAYRVEKNLEKATSKKNLRTCRNGHKYYKSSDGPTCPICEQERKPQDDFLSLLVAPARRALENKGITNIQELSKYSEEEVLKLHGFGPSSLPKLRQVLADNKLSFRQ